MALMEHGREARKKHLLSNTNMAEQFRYSKAHLNKSQKFWSDGIWHDETNVDTFGHHA